MRGRTPFGSLQIRHAGSRLRPGVCLAPTRITPAVAAFADAFSGDARQTRRTETWLDSCKTLSFFDASGACSIDFSQFTPMFRLDAARYRNAIS
jgi:hypothetical protein